MPAVWDDERVRRGMMRQLELRRRRLSTGELPLGWKVAFGAPSAKQNLALSGPAVGFMTDRSTLDNGADVPVSTWTHPVLEPEIVVEMSADLPPGSDEQRAAACIAGLGPAIELADLDVPLDQLEDVVATNIFHRHVILGPIDNVRAGGDVTGVTAKVRRNGRADTPADDPLAMVGSTLTRLACHISDLLAAFGERLRAGDLVITGSVVPLLHVEPGDNITVELSTLGSLSVSFSA